VDEDTDLEVLRRQVRFLLDRTKNLDVIARQSRGHDRHDAEVISAVNHGDGIDEHGYAVMPASGYAAWINAVHSAGSQFGRPKATGVAEETAGQNPRMPVAKYDRPPLTAVPG
jgi:hypothetical protein